MLDQIGQHNYFDRNQFIVGLAYNHPWMLTTLGCPFVTLALVVVGYMICRAQWGL